MYLCNCKAISEQHIEEAVDQGVRTLGDLVILLGIGVGCGQCTDGVRAFLDRRLAALTQTEANAALPPLIEVAVPPPASQEPAPARAAWFAIDL